MNSSQICSRCMRALRQNPRLEQRSQTISIISSRTRAFSTKTSSWQQQAQQKPEETPIPPIMPTTAATVTTNIAAPLPNPPPSKAKPGLPTDSPSVAEMQRRITSSISRPDLTTQLAKKLRKTARSATESYMTYGVTESIFKSCGSQAAYTIPKAQRMGILTGTGPPKTATGEDLGEPEHASWWFDTIGLEPTFSTWSQVTYLNMYIVTVRLRALDDTRAFQNYQRYLLEHFSHAAEDKMEILHGMSARGIRNRYLKDLFLQWRGILAAYDEGLVRGDAVLAGAVWRNLFKGKEDVDWEKVALVVLYMRKAIAWLGSVEIEQVVHRLNGPNGVWAVCQRDENLGQSEGIAEPFENRD